MNGSARPVTAEKPINAITSGTIFTSSRPMSPLHSRRRFTILKDKPSYKSKSTNWYYTRSLYQKHALMITKITGQLVALHGDTLILKIDAFEYEVLIPEFTRRQLQSELNQSVSLHTIEYMEGNPMQGRMTPRLVGFLSEIEREFFDLFCSVDGVGVKKCLRAMVRPVKEVATAIEEQDAKTLSSLPGIGPAMAERIIAKLRRKVPSPKPTKSSAPSAIPKAKPGVCSTRRSRRKRSSKTCRA
jgi:Holliday junction DNA helicase RuvA